MDASERNEPTLLGCESKISTQFALQIKEKNKKRTKIGKT